MRIKRTENANEIMAAKQLNTNYTNQVKNNHKKNESIFTQEHPEQEPAKINGYQEKSLTEIALEEFKKLDLDGNLKVSEQEFIDNVINNYVTTRDEYGARPTNIADYIQDKAEQFRKHAGDDNSMNIDEYNIFKKAGN